MRDGILSRLLGLAIVAWLAGCSGGDRGIGEPCGSHGDCDGTLQCSSGVCVPRCARAPDCGDGYSCSSDGLCLRSDGQPGDSCKSEVDCSPGLSCQIDGNASSGGHLLASCTAQGDGKPAGSSCTEKTEREDCRNGTCALGQCVDLCEETRDCAAGYSCMEIPRVKAGGALFAGCLPSSGNVIWSIPLTAPSETILLPVPSSAHSASLVFTVDDPSQQVGTQTFTSPTGEILYKRPCNPAFDPVCDPVADFFDNIVRHRPEFTQSVIAIPSTPSVPLETGAYRVHVSSYRAGGAGTAVPRVTAIVRIDTATLLDLRFHFLDLQDHMCQSSMGPVPLDATSAPGAPFFKDDFIGELRAIFAHGGVALGNLSYVDVKHRPDLDSLDIANAGDLLSLGSSVTGVNVFFVRTLSPVGIQAFGPNPGPAGLAFTPQSGIVIGLDTLCFRSWKQLARLTAHEIARYMGLSHNVELAKDPNDNLPYHDLIGDTPEFGDETIDNLMFFSELGGTDISPGQRDILTRSPVLR